MNLRQFPAPTDPATYGTELGLGDLTPRQEEYLSKTARLSAPLMERAFRGKASPRAAIKANCLACTNFQRKEVEFCNSVCCPLWRYRPFQKSADRGG